MGLHVFEVTLGTTVCILFLCGISLLLLDWLRGAFVLSYRGSSLLTSSSCSNPESSDPICTNGSLSTSGEGFVPPLEIFPYPFSLYQFLVVDLHSTVVAAPL